MPINSGMGQIILASPQNEMVSTNEKEQSTDNSHSGGSLTDTALSQIGKDRDTMGVGSDWQGLALLP